MPFKRAKFFSGTLYCFSFSIYLYCVALVFIRGAEKYIPHSDLRVIFRATPKHFQTFQEAVAHASELKAQLTNAQALEWPNWVLSSPIHSSVTDITSRDGEGISKVEYTREFQPEVLVANFSVYRQLRGKKGANGIESATNLHVLKRDLNSEGTIFKRKNLPEDQLKTRGKDTLENPSEDGCGIAKSDYRKLKLELARRSLKESKIDVFATGKHNFVPKRDIAQWLNRYGLPKSIPPASWCSATGMTIAIPENSENFLSKQSEYGLLNASWAETNGSCRVELVPDFFKTAAKDKIGAWIGYAPYNSCGGTTVESATHRYYINRLLTPLPSRNVIGICSCPKDLTASPQDNENKDVAQPLQCFPSSQWESKTHSQVAEFTLKENQSIENEDLLPHVGKSMSGGFALSAVATAGEGNEIVIKNADSKVIFESYVHNSSGYLWPLTCEVVNLRNETNSANNFALIINGCPVSSKLNFTVHSSGPKSATNPLGLKPGHIVFSFAPITFSEEVQKQFDPTLNLSEAIAHEESFLRFRCRMGVFTAPVTEEEFCQQLSVVMYETNVEQASVDENGAMKNLKPLTFLPSSKPLDRSSTSEIPLNLFRTSEIGSQLHNDSESQSTIPLSTTSHRNLQFESLAIENMKPEYIKAVSGPQQISSWKAYNGGDYFENYWNRRDEAFEREELLKERSQTQAAIEKQKAALLSQAQLHEREQLLRYVILTQHDDFKHSNPLNSTNITAALRQVPTDTPHSWIKHDLSTEKASLTDEESKIIEQHLREVMPLGETFAGEIFTRYTPPTSQLLDKIDSTVVYGPWAVSWNRVSSRDFERVSIGTNRGAIGVGGSVPQRSQVTSLNWGPNAISVSSDATKELARVAVLRGRHGVNIERSNALQATNIETVSRFVETATLVDQLNSIYGERIRVRNFDLAFRRDFAPESPTTTSLAYNPLTQEIALNYRSITVIIGSNRIDREYLTSVGLRGYQFTTIRDFDENVMDFQANWGNGWQAVLKTDFIDPLNSQIFTGVELGKLGRAYAGAAVGVGSDGIPQGSATVQTADLGFSVEFVDSAGTRLLNYALTVGKFTFTWESSVVLDNLLVPALIFPSLTTENLQ